MSLAFDRQEFDARLARVREQMADQNLDVVLVFGQDQMFYLTGYDQIGYSYYQVWSSRATIHGLFTSAGKWMHTLFVKLWLPKTSASGTTTTATTRPNSLPLSYAN